MALEPTRSLEPNSLLRVQRALEPRLVLQRPCVPAPAVPEAGPALEPIFSALKTNPDPRPRASSLEHSLISPPNLSLQAHHSQEPPLQPQARWLGLSLKMEAGLQPAPGQVLQPPIWAPGHKPPPLPRSQPFHPSPSWDPRSPCPPPYASLLAPSRGPSPTRGSRAGAVPWAQWWNRGLGFRSLAANLE